MEIKELLVRLKEKENRAYIRLFDLFFGKLHAFASTIIGSQDDAKDIVQTVIINLYENSHIINSDFKLAAWLTTSVRNRCLNYLRDHNIEIRHKASYVEIYETAETWELADDTDLMEKIRQVMSKMPPQLQTVCHMRFFENRKINEIAEKLGVTPGTVKQQISRGTKKIREALSAEETLILFIYAALKRL